MPACSTPIPPSCVTAGITFAALGAGVGAEQQLSGQLGQRRWQRGLLRLLTCLLLECVQLLLAGQAWGHGLLQLCTQAVQVLAACTKLAQLLAHVVQVSLVVGCTAQ